MNWDDYLRRKGARPETEFSVSEQSTVVARFNRYWSGLRPSKLGKSMEIRSEIKFSGSQRTANSPRTCPEASEHVSMCFRCRSGRNTIENLPTLIKINEIHPKSNQILQIQAKSTFQKKIEIFQVFGLQNYF